MKGKQHFTQHEADQVCELIRQKLAASSSQQKRIRDKIRKLRFYASDFGIGGGYTVDDFLRVAIIDGKTQFSSTVKTTPNSARNSSKTRIRNRCEITGRPHGVYRKLKISRIALRDLASKGKIPGMTKSSW